MAGDYVPCETDLPNGVRLDATHTTMTLPHRKFGTAHTYYVAVYPEGDLAIHEWTFGCQAGYGGMIVGFLMVVR